MEVCPPRYDDVVSHPFVRMGKWNSVPHYGNRGDCNPCRGNGWSVWQVDSGVFVLILSTWPRGTVSERGLFGPRPR
jgi:hypothetical protein